mmetsp:Transcript_20915/g.33376  ORF Transcript_20915/g.33376 Transcript_20915/m.33376 type:complete len:211 (-) Transcript_20915:430-1062(-)
MIERANQFLLIDEFTGHEKDDWFNRPKPNLLHHENDGLKRSRDGWQLTIVSAAHNHSIILYKLTDIALYHLVGVVHHRDDKVDEEDGCGQHPTKQYHRAYHRSHATHIVEALSTKIVPVVEAHGIFVHVIPSDAGFSMCLLAICIFNQNRIINLSQHGIKQCTHCHPHRRELFHFAVGAQMNTQCKAKQEQHNQQHEIRHVAQHLEERTN